VHNYKFVIHEKLVAQKTQKRKQT